MVLGALVFTVSESFSSSWFSWWNVSLETSMTLKLAKIQGCSSVGPIASARTAKSMPPHLTLVPERLLWQEERNPIWNRLMGPQKTVAGGEIKESLNSFDLGYWRTSLNVEVHHCHLGHWDNSIYLHRIKRCMCEKGECMCEKHLCVCLYVWDCVVKIVPVWGKCVILQGIGQLDLCETDKETLLQKLNSWVECSHHILYMYKIMGTAGTWCDSTPCWCRKSTAKSSLTNGL